jgi:nitrogen-specific signal transduction histidine kinase
MRLRLIPSKAPESPPAARRGLELLATAVLLLDESCRVTYVNPAAENLFELSLAKF